MPPARKPAPDKPPASAAPGAAPRGPGRPSKADQLRDQLVTTYQGLAIMSTPILAMTGAPAELVQVDAGIILANAEACADAWVAVAKTNPKVMKALEGTVQGGGWIGVIVAHAGIVLGIAQAHAQYAQAIAANAADNVTPIAGTEASPA